MIEWLEILRPELIGFRDGMLLSVGVLGTTTAKTVDPRDWKAAIDVLKPRAVERRKMNLQFWLPFLVNLLVVILGGGIWAGSMNGRITALVAQSDTRNDQQDKLLVERTADRYTARDARRDQELWEVKMAAVVARIANMESSIRRASDSLQDVKTSVASISFKLEGLPAELSKMQENSKRTREWLSSLRDRNEVVSEQVADHLQSHNER